MDIFTPHLSFCYHLGSLYDARYVLLDEEHTQCEAVACALAVRPLGCQAVAQGANFDRVPQWRACAAQMQCMAAVGRPLYRIGYDLATLWHTSVRVISSVRLLPKALRPVRRDPRCR
jgi:hypothetical protein